MKCPVLEKGCLDVDQLIPGRISLVRIGRKGFDMNMPWKRAFFDMAFATNITRIGCVGEPGPTPI